MKYSFIDQTIRGGCGISNLCVFRRRNARNFYCNLPSVYSAQAGCGWILISFINTKLMHTVYADACKKYKLVYQSKVRTNRNSRNKFFFCIFDAKENHGNA